MTDRSLYPAFIIAGAVLVLAAVVWLATSSIAQTLDEMRSAQWLTVHILCEHLAVGPRFMDDPCGPQ
jgi:hypothetical protein